MTARPDAAPGPKPHRHQGRPPRSSRRTPSPGTDCTHRRLRREDVDQARQRTTRSNRSDRRSRWLNIAVAGELVRNPDTILQRARANLELLQANHPRGRGAMWLREWEKLLNGPVEDVLDALTSQTPRARELRANSPFAGVLSSEDREKALHAFQTHQRLRPS
jgi:hypothetical protein